MSRILKFTLHDHGVAIVPMPIGAKLLHVADQCGAIQLWVRVDGAVTKLQSRCIATLYTGFDEVPDGATFIGTVLSAGGSIVRHVFEVKA